MCIRDRIKAKNNDLITMGVMHRIGKNFIDIGSSRNELPSIPYNLLVKICLLYTSRIEMEYKTVEGSNGKKQSTNELNLSGLSEVIGLYTCENPDGLIPVGKNCLLYTSARRRTKKRIL